LTFWRPGKPGDALIHADDRADNAQTLNGLIAGYILSIETELRLMGSGGAVRIG
jgi:hypothetical protein